MFMDQIRKYCPSCNVFGLHARPATSHIVHCLLTLFFCGLWLPIWILASFKIGGWRCQTCGHKKSQLALLAVLSVVTLSIILSIINYLNNDASNTDTAKRTPLPKENFDSVKETLVHKTENSTRKPTISKEKLQQPENKVPSIATKETTYEEAASNVWLKGLSIDILEEKLALDSKGFIKVWSEDGSKSPWKYNRIDAAAEYKIIVTGKNSLVLQTIEATIIRLDGKPIESSAANFLGTIASLGYDSNYAKAAKEWVKINTENDSQKVIGKLRFHTFAPSPNKRILQISAE